MKETHFSIGEVLKTGWEGWKKHWLLLAAVVAISLILGGISNIGFALFKDSVIAQNLFQLLGILIGTYASLGVINISLKIAKQLAVQLADYFDTFPYFWKFLLGQILYYVAVAIGLILFIIPGIYIALKYFLFPYFIIEKDMGVIDAFKASGKATNGSKGQLLLFAITGALINILGLICLVVGLFVSIPVVAIAQAAIYKTLSSQLDEIDRF